MKLDELGEFGLIERLARGGAAAPEHVVVGIGDDCAVTRCRGEALRLTSTDMLVEGVHFTREATTPRQLGAKALAVNLSDIAAMGGHPREVYVALAIPPAWDVEDVEQLYGGLRALAQRHDVALLGGDTTRAAGAMVISITVVGDAPADQLLYRHGGRPGDRLFVSGTLGDAAAGLHALLHGRGARAQGLVQRQLEPLPRLELGRRVAASGLATAMIDLSDGLAGDLGHVCDRSGVGCEVRCDALPRSAELTRYCARFGLDPLELALTGGEDYELLVAGDAALAELGLVQVGQLTGDEARQIVLPGGTRRPLQTGGWDHFRRSL